MLMELEGGPWHELTMTRQIKYYTRHLRFITNWDLVWLLRIRPDPRSDPPHIHTYTHISAARAHGLGLPPMLWANSLRPWMDGWMNRCIFIFRFLSSQAVFYFRNPAICGWRGLSLGCVCNTASILDLCDFSNVVMCPWLTMLLWLVSTLYDVVDMIG